jgi:tRNA 2-thiouridine synthesizing protein E
MDILKPEMFNENGFLKDPRAWDEGICIQIAKREGIGRLDDTHWKIIRYLRNYYERFNFLPSLRRACKVTGAWQDSCLSCFFHSDPLRAVKIAGLPEPGDEVKFYYQGDCRCRRPPSSPPRPHETVRARMSSGPGAGFSSHNAGK